jgi:hypothetical protein
MFGEQPFQNRQMLHAAEAKLSSHIQLSDPGEQNNNET